MSASTSTFNTSVFLEAQAGSASPSDSISLFLQDLGPFTASTITGKNAIVTFKELSPSLQRLQFAQNWAVIYKSSGVDSGRLELSIQQYITVFSPRTLLREGWTAFQRFISTLRGSVTLASFAVSDTEWELISFVLSSPATLRAMTQATGHNGSTCSGCPLHDEPNPRQDSARLFMSYIGAFMLSNGDFGEQRLRPWLTRHFDVLARRLLTALRTPDSTLEAATAPAPRRKRRVPSDDGDDEERASAWERKHKHSLKRIALINKTNSASTSPKTFRYLSHRHPARAIKIRKLRFKSGRQSGKSSGENAENALDAKQGESVMVHKTLWLYPHTIPTEIVQSCNLCYPFSFETISVDLQYWSMVTPIGHGQPLLALEPPPSSPLISSLLAHKTSEASLCVFADVEVCSSSSEATTSEPRRMVAHPHHHRLPLVAIRAPPSPQQLDALWYQEGESFTLACYLCVESQGRGRPVDDSLSTNSPETPCAPLEIVDAA
ncbi:hypothetical protein R3P38DRAFT_2799603 [Favolaschia claudopus]|uniref:Uncharacterized protein n=1 Tax=Favolaschia claudopus TaxID=2862362 RepID=A0AAW0A0Z4_9AGAR